MRLTNPFFTSEDIIKELDVLKSKLKKELNPLEVLQNRIKHEYVGMTISNEQFLEQLNQPAFDDFPRLKDLLQKIFKGQSNIEISEELKDWEPDITFTDINNKYHYFDNDLSPLFQQLAIACRKMTSLIEQQAYDKEMAYKLMALFYDPNKSLDDNFQLISKKFDNLITTKQDKSIKTPYHDAFVTMLQPFPEYTEHFESWKAFIVKEGLKSLPIFAQFAHRPAFINIQNAKIALLEQTYPRAKNNPILAELCNEMLITNAGFEAGLKVVQTGWPKKETDHLPIVDISDHSGQYFWVKLPPQDMRALYLGNLIPGCCQFINGHSSQCVKDGIQLSDNGFYVLLKSKKQNTDTARIVNGQINNKDYNIVAQAYAWKSSNGNLCLDSIEWNRQRVSTAVIQELMSLFSQQVFSQHPDIKYINVGTGGQTPRGLFPVCLIHESMKQGFIYIDAVQQYRIASNILQDIRSNLQRRLQNFSPDFQQTILYLAPYFQDIENIPDELLKVNANIEAELPLCISKIKLPSKLSANDFKKITYVEYQQMDEYQQSSVSTVCKIFNSQNEHELRKWLPTIPDEELPYICLIKNNYSLNFRFNIFKRLPPKFQIEMLYDIDFFNHTMNVLNADYPQFIKMILEHLPSEQRLTLVTQKDYYENSILLKSVSNPKLIKIIIELLPERQRFEAIKEKNRDGNAILFEISQDYKTLEYILELLTKEQRFAITNEKDIFGNSILLKSAENPERLKMILELYPTKEARFEAVQTRNNEGQFALYLAALNPESLKILLELYPTDETRLEAIHEKNAYGQSILYKAALNPESLKIILGLYPTDEARLAAIKERDIHRENALFMASSNLESLNIILDIYPTDAARLEAIKQKNNLNQSVLYFASTNPKCLKMLLDIFPTHQRLDAVIEKDKQDRSILHKIISNPECLQMVFDLIPTEQLNVVINEKDKNGNPIIFGATNHLESLKIILNLYPTNEARISAILEKNIKGHTVIFYALSYPHSLKMMLELIPPEHRLEAIKEKDIHLNSVLIKSFSEPELFEIILERIPPEHRLEAVKETDIYLKSILLKSISNPKLFKIILTLLPEEQRLQAMKEANINTNDLFSNSKVLKIFLELLPEEQRLAAVLEKDINGNSIFIKSMSNFELLKMILELIPPTERLETIKENDSYENSIFISVISNYELMKIIFERLPTIKLFEMFKAKDINGKSIFKTPESLRVILQLIPDEQRINLIKEKDKDGHSLLNQSYSNPPLFKVLIEVIPETQRLAFIKQKDWYGNSILNTTYANPKLFKIMLEMLPQIQRFEILKEKDFYGKSIFIKSISNPQTLQVMVDTLPEEIALVIKSYVHHLKPKDLEKATFSMIQFTNALKNLVPPDSIKHFIQALVSHEGIEEAQNALLSSGSSLSFFTAHSTKTIQQCIKKLDPLWFSHLPRPDNLHQNSQTKHHQISLHIIHSKIFTS